MDDKAKVELIALLINATIKTGMPALVKIVDNLKNKNKITSEDISALRIDIEAETFFEGRPECFGNMNLPTISDIRCKKCSFEKSCGASSIF